ncbi:MAG: hypothetical protein RIR62_2045, partial [Pseudomonadota bacterium]
SALFIWWFATGAILWRVTRADLQGRDAHLWSVLLGLPLLLGGFAGLAATRDDATVQAVYIAFLSALAIWGWIELAFLSGIITGPNRQPCPDGTPLPRRLWRAVGTILWHEMALLAALMAIAQYTLGGENRFGLWTFALLLGARVSAKLNLFFGVPRIHTEFLPRPLSHLPSHFRLAPMNWVFPLSVSALTFASACWLERVWAATTEGQLIGFTLLSALTLLALLEHWFMVIPLPDQKLWRWMIPADRQSPTMPVPPAPPARPLTVRK